MTPVEIVSKESHHFKRWRRSEGYQFAAADSLCPLVAHELPKAMLNMPLAFIPSEGSYFPVAVQGLAANTNLFVGEDGSWLAGYIPAAYRAYPFSLHADNAGRELLCIAKSSIAESFESGSESFFDESGELSAAVQEVLKFQSEYSRNRKSTQQLCGLLQKHELIVPWPLAVEADNGKVNLDGLFRVDEARIAMLQSEALCELRDAGAFALLYCQLLSMQNILQLRRLLEFRVRKSASATANAATQTGLLLDSGTISFDSL